MLHDLNLKKRKNSKLSTGTCTRVLGRGGAWMDAKEMSETIDIHMSVWVCAREYL
jgi:hypothetical protein